MKHLIIILLTGLFILTPIALSSSGLVHLTHASVINDPVFNYYINKFNLDANIIDKQEMEYEFYIGSIFPDIFRYYEQYPEIFNSLPSKRKMGTVV